MSEPTLADDVFIYLDDKLEDPKDALRNMIPIIAKEFEISIEEARAYIQQWLFTYYN